MNYCMTFNICYHDYVDKIKIDYSIIPAENKDGKWKSTVSNETIEVKKCKFGYLNFFKNKNQVFCSIIMENLGDDMLEAEKTLLKVSKKYLIPKLFFKPKYKEALNKRIERIFHSNV